MIISEKGLVRALKAAYKNGGYNVMNAGEELILYTERWYVQIDWHELPRKALAVLVEHMGMIPATGAGWSVMVGEAPQRVMDDVLGDEISDWVQEGTEEPAQRTPLHYDGSRIYQAVDDGACYAVSPFHLGIAEDSTVRSKETMVVQGNRIEWKCDGERVAIVALRGDSRVWKTFESIALCKEEK